jgi:L-ascorbate metabolism protein UlaG (beta-lactamase superfamily)
MDIQFYGANCLVLSGKLGRIVVDDTLAELGGKSVAKEGDICLFTTGPHKAADKVKISIGMPGEYEVNNISIFGLQVRSHVDEADQKTGVMYKITWGETKVLVAGHAYPKLSDDELEALGIVDVMFVPVGGHGYTMDGTGALQLIKQIEPKVVVPTHYADSGLKYEVPQASLEEALKELSMEPKETVKKLQFKPAEATDNTQLVVLEKS